MTAMMIERHYDDETLISLMETNCTRGDKHIPACTVCAEKLDSFRTLSTAMREEDVWDTRASEPVPSTISNLRKFANRMTSEDAQADLFLPELLAGPRDTWMPRLREHPEWRTAGAVRKILAAANTALDTMPPDAVEMTTLATEIADHLDPATHTSDVVARLRGAAWRDRGYALFYTGQFLDAETAVARADDAFAHCVVDEYDRARVNIVRSLVMRAQERIAPAMDAIRTSADAFSRFEDVKRLASARLAEARILYSRSDFAAAMALLEKLEPLVTNDGDTHARVLSNLGYCAWKLGRSDEALRYDDDAAALFDALGVRTESIRIRWGVASILVGRGRVAEARTRFNELKNTFDRLGMISEATLVRLDIAELLLAAGDYASVEDLCRTAVRALEQGGISYGARALTALAYMREAVSNQTATPQHVKHVREYIRRLPQEAELLFLPLPN